MPSAIEATLPKVNKSAEPTVSNLVNIARYLKDLADEQPYKRAVVFPQGRDDQGRVAYTHLTFQQLHRDSDSLAHGLNQHGITRGTRIIFMVSPSLDFFTILFALFKVGAVPVMVNPAMGTRQLLNSFKESRAEAMIGPTKAHMLRILHPGSFKNLKHVITIGKRWFWGGPTLCMLHTRPWKPFPIAETNSSDIAAIIFTTGTTGPAKGTIYPHGVLEAQVRTFRTTFGLSADQINLPTFPLFAIFDLILGMTVVIADMELTLPAKADPKKIFEAYQNQGISHMSASPALLDRVGLFSNRINLKAPSLQQVISHGAPVAPNIIKNFAKVLGKENEIITSYGATEAMPITAIGSNEILTKTLPLTERGFGVCVGRPVDGVTVRIIEISDGPIATWAETKVMSEGEIGEIVVQGDLVTRNYFERPEDDTLSKIMDGEQFWHRMGDLGWCDQHGRIWFCGRKSQRVRTQNKTYFTIPCEAIFNTHSRVFRSALVGVGPVRHQRPVICIELEANDNGQNKKQLTQELLSLAKANVLTEDIDAIVYHKQFPVDSCHNAKINREKLAQWASNQIRHKG